MEAGISLLRGKNIRDRYASNNQALQKSGIFVEATNEIEGQLSMSEKRERERAPSWRRIKKLQIEAIREKTVMRGRVAYRDLTWPNDWTLFDFSLLRQSARARIYFPSSSFYFIKSRNKNPERAEFFRANRTSFCTFINPIDGRISAHQRYLINFEGWSKLVNRYQDKPYWLQ